MASSAQMLRSGSGVATTFATVVRASRRNHSLLAAACSRQPQNRRVVATTSLFQGMGSVKGLLLGEGLPRLGCRHLSEHGSAPSATAKWMDSYQRHFSETEALNKWMVQVREQPENLEGDRVVGALMAFLLHGMFSGQNSLASAVFWAHLLQTATADDCTMLFSDLVQACESGLVPREEEQCDTFFRALFLKNDPDLDVFLRQVRNNNNNNNLNSNNFNNNLNNYFNNNNNLNNYLNNYLNNNNKAKHLCLQSVVLHPVRAR